MIKEKLFLWACDYSDNSGEGKLARLFVKKLNFRNQFYLKFNQKKIIKTKYVSTFIGIIFCWKKYLRSEKVCYLNYLPLWNFLIFILLPPNTLLGPITGGAHYSKSNKINFLIRAIIFPVCYKISEFFLYFRSKNIIFSTDLLKKYLSKKTINKSEFNFVLKDFLLKKKKKKKIDFLIYYRKHKNKEIFFPHNLIQNLLRFKYSIHIIGDELKIRSITNHGFISRKKVSKLQSLAKYTIASGENLYSFFILECLSNNMKIIIDKKSTFNISFLRKKFLKIDFKNYKGLNKLKKYN